MTAFAARHVKEDEKADDGNEEHAAGHGSHDKDKKVFFLTLAAAMRGHKDRLDEPLLWRDLQHVVQLKAWGGGLLLGRSIVPLPFSLTSSHHQEDEQPHQGYESQCRGWRGSISPTISLALPIRLPRSPSDLSSL